VPSEGRGATFFAAMATPKWPMNMGLAAPRKRNERRPA
jgi:hypothetical protein